MAKGSVHLRAAKINRNGAILAAVITSSAGALYLFQSREPAVVSPTGASIAAPPGTASADISLQGTEGMTPESTLAQRHTTSLPRSESKAPSSRKETERASATPRASLSGREAGLGGFLPPAIPGGGTFLLANSNDANAYWSRDLGAGLFDHAVRSGLNGMADANHDGRLMVSELERYVVEFHDSYAVKTLNSGVHRPVTGRRGVDFAIEGASVPFRRASGAFITLDDYDQGINDIEHDSVAAATNILRSRLALRVFERRVPWNLLNVTALLGDLESDTDSDELLVVWFTGYTEIGNDGLGKWLLYSPQGDEVLRGPELAAYLERSPAKFKLIVVDGAFGQAPPYRRH